ncbi:DNA/RNA non-specific endonuclease [Actinoplanes sp. NPDC051859]|uniref:DNA/RNA non-specific endonuclease n=1 Tax=Actinoplanes sp. NPDC051859 TaxID=3363909 RepID=UPI0037AF6220
MPTHLIQFILDGGRVVWNNPRLVVHAGINDPNQADYDHKRRSCLNNGAKMIRYFDMEEDVASGAEACYPGALPGGGTDATFTPEGFESGKGMARGHLIAKELGGSGSDGRNIVALYQNKVNSSAMWHGVEKVVQAWVEEGQDVYYRVVPEFKNNDPGNNPVPTHVRIIVAANRGAITARIENRK